MNASAKHELKRAAKQSIVATAVGTGVAMAMDGGLSFGNFADKLLLMGAPIMAGGLAINFLAEDFESSKFGGKKYYPERALIGGAGAVGFMMLVGAVPVEISVGNLLAGVVAALSIAAGDYLVYEMRDGSAK